MDWGPEAEDEGEEAYTAEEWVEDPGRLFPEDEEEFDEEDDFYEAGEAGGADGFAGEFEEEFTREERDADGGGPPHEVRPGAGWEGESAGPGAPPVGVSPAGVSGVPPAGAFVVSTLLSRKPKAGAVRAVAWTLGLAAAFSAIYWWGPPDWARALPASGETVFGRAEVWRLFTSMAAHADALHLLSNSVLLTLLVYFAYGAFGSSLYPGGALPVGALALAVTLEGYPPNIRVVGASGMVYLLAGACLTLYVLVERRLSVVKRLVRVVGFSLLVLVPTSVRPEVSYRAHAVGFFFGVCLGLVWFLSRRDAIRAAERWAPPE